MLKASTKGLLYHALECGKEGKGDVGAHALNAQLRLKVLSESLEEA